MNLPKTPENEIIFKNKKQLEALLLPVGIVVVLLFILIIGFVMPKQKQSNTVGKKNIDQFTKTTTVKTSSGQNQTVPPQVLQITPVQLKAKIDSKEEITLIQVVDGEGWNYPHIKGAEIINKKHFATSTVGLDQQKTNILISKDGYESALAITKLINFGFNREKNLNLEGGLDAWQAKGYGVEN